MVGVGRTLLGAGWVLVGACGDTEVDCPGLVEELSGHTSKTIGTTTAVAAAAISVTFACFVRCHGGGGDRNVNVLLFGARS